MKKWNKVIHNRVVKIITDENVLVAELDTKDRYYVCHTPEGVDKNAKLIAAAPELLEACISFKENIDNWLDTGDAADPETSKKIYEQVEKAIEKALNK